MGFNRTGLAPRPRFAGGGRGPPGGASSTPGSTHQRRDWKSFTKRLEITNTASDGSKWWLPKLIIINSNNMNRLIAVAVNIRRTRTTPAAEVVVVMEEITTATTTMDIIIATTATTMVIPSAAVTRGGAQNASHSGC